MAVDKLQRAIYKLQVDLEELSRWLQRSCLDGSRGDAAVVCSSEAVDGSRKAVEGSDELQTVEELQMAPEELYMYRLQAIGLQT